MAWWDAFSNSGYGYEPESGPDIPIEFVEIFGPVPRVEPGASPNIHVDAARNLYYRRAENFKGIVEVDFDKYLKDLLNSLPLKGKETKDTWMQLSDPRNWEMGSPVFYEENDGAKFLAFPDNNYNIVFNRVFERSFRNSPSGRIVRFQVTCIQEGIYVGNVHPGLIAPFTLAKNRELNPIKDL